MPAGTHETRLDNDGGDWIEAQYYVFTNVRDPARFPDLEAHALRTGTGALLWVRNRLNEWAFRAAGTRLHPTVAAAALVPGLPAGGTRLNGPREPDGTAHCDWRRRPLEYMECTGCVAARDGVPGTMLKKLQSNGYAWPGSQSGAWWRTASCWWCWPSCSWGSATWQALRDRLLPWS